MKRVLAFLSAIVLALGLVACKSGYSSKISDVKSALEETCHAEKAESEQYDKMVDAKYPIQDVADDFKDGAYAEVKSKDRTFFAFHTVVDHSDIESVFKYVKADPASKDKSGMVANMEVLVIQFDNSGAANRYFDDIMNSPKAEKFPEDGVFNRNTTVWPGDLKFEDVNKDGRINELDRTNIGSPLPLFTFGWTNTFRYKNVDLSIFLNGSFGNKVLNYNMMGQGYNGLVHMNSVWVNQHNSIASRARLAAIDPSKEWIDDVTNVRVLNADTKTPRPTIADPNDNDRLSDRYVEDGSYLRIKNITLGYNFPKSLLSKAKIDNIRIYMNVQNVYTFTKYMGYDPEVGASTQDSSGLTFGVDNGRYPSPMTCSFGVNITF